VVALLGAVAVSVVACRPRSTAPVDTPPAWAYPVSSDAPAPSGMFVAPDVHPEDHPPMPDVVAHGRAPDVLACGFCHRADGSGAPENAGLAGLPADYIAHAVGEIARGARRSAVPRLPGTLMERIAKAATPDEIAAAAAYFSTIAPRPHVRVVEAAQVPETVVVGFVLEDAKTGRTEPIGSRIVELPEDVGSFEARDGRAGFVAYVPPGSLARGRELATSGDHGKTVACGACHGHDLRGAGAVPRIAGRSPGYLVRQLWDMKHGFRTGPTTAPMAPVVQRLSLEEMIALAAWTASLPP
jgi:cytochrome c553